MAIYHLTSKIIKRSKGRSTVACAAYRAGEELHDDITGKTFKFKRQDRVADKFIIAPDNAQPWVLDRGQLWNSLEAVERRHDAQLAKEIELALPNNLPKRLQTEILTGFIHEHFTAKGFVADVAIHHAPIGKPDNDHAHVMTTLRGIDPETGGWRKTKDRADSRTEFAEGNLAALEVLRASWAKHVNIILEREGIDDRIDHRSNKTRQINALPGTHIGYAGQGIEERGGRSWRVALNRQIRQTNQRILAEIKAKMPAWLGLERTPAAPKQEPAPAPIAAKPAPAPVMPPPTIPDIEAEKRKKAAREAAWRHHQGGGVGG